MISQIFLPLRLSFPPETLPRNMKNYALKARKIESTWKGQIEQATVSLVIDVMVISSPVVAEVFFYCNDCRCV